jgi:prepilin-type N-terminal cleavage/methylation domain-containing protein
MMRRALSSSVRRRLAGEAGYSLMEMITVMVILGTVLAGLTTMFHAGMTAEVKANRELDAQQNARAALDRMRRELHCASAISATNGVAVSSVTVTLPTVCTGTDTTVTYATVAVSANRWKLTRTGATVSTVADYLTSSTVFTYYVPAAGTLGRLRVDFPVNITPADASTLWRLQDDIVLRNTSRL